VTSVKTFGFTSQAIFAYKAHVKLLVSLLASAFLFLPSDFALAGSATWNVSPTSGDWNTAANWMPASVPNSPTDVATFGVSNITSVSTLSGPGVFVAGLRFDPGASEYTITVDTSHDLGLADFGIENDSGLTQNIVVGAEHDDGNSNPALNLFNHASAGDRTIFTCKAGTVTDIIGGFITFQNNSHGGSATIIAEGAPPVR
jgi:hypothetical protein